MSHGATFLLGGYMFLLPSRFSLLLAATASTAILATPVAAQASSERSFDIPALPLNEAVRLFMQQSGIQVTYSSNDGAGIRTTAVRGRLASAAALSQLLGGTGLTFRYLTANSVALSPAPQAAGNAIQLGPVQVEGQGDTIGITDRGPATDPGKSEGERSYATPIVTTATRLNLTPRETPQSVSVVTEQAIRDQNLLSVTDVLSTVTGLSVMNGLTDRTWFYSRGFIVNSFQFDGIPTIMDNITQAGEALSDTIWIDRVEVVRGATGLLSGPGEPSAAVNLVRKRADSRVFAGSFTAAAGSWNNYRGTFDLAAPLTAGGGLRARVAGAYQNRESFTDLYKNEKVAIYGTVEADLGARTTAAISVSYQENNPKGSAWAGVPLLFEDGTKARWSRSQTTAPRWARWDTSSRFVHLDVDHDLGGGWIAHGKYANDKGKFDTRLLYVYGAYPSASAIGAGGLDLFAYSDFGYRRQDALDLYATGPFTLFGRQHELSFGIQGIDRRFKLSQRAATPASNEGIGDLREWDGSYPEPSFGTVTLRNNDLTKQRSAYVSSRFSLASGLTLIAGTRLTHWKRDQYYRARTYRYEPDLQVIPYAGLVADLTGNVSAYASYTEIFNPQNFQDRNGRYLDPVQGENYEIGVKGAWFDNRLNASVALFRLKQDNVAKQDGSALVDGTIYAAYIATDGVVSKGIEAELAGDITPRWHVTLGYSYNDAKDPTGARVVPDIAHSLFRGFTSYRLSDGPNGLSFGGGVTWTGSRQVNDIFPGNSTVSYTVREAPYLLANLFAKYDLNERLSVQANLNNLFDKRYYVGINSDGQGWFGEPRSVMVTLRGRF